MALALTPPPICIASTLALILGVASEPPRPAQARIITDPSPMHEIDPAPALSCADRPASPGPHREDRPCHVSPRSPSPR